MLASDGSNNALRAVESALKLVSKGFSIITLLYIIDPSKVKKNSGQSNYDELIRQQIREEKLKSTEELLIKHGVSYEVKILDGNPETEIIKFVNSHPHEMLIMGSRGLNAFQEMVLGSVSHKVMKFAKLPVLVVK